jgi:hypothetical protein
LTTVLIWRLSPTRLEEPAILATGCTILRGGEPMTR